ncbi:hypothetical protein [Nocardia puris]|uniref:Anti-sigma-M factor RsmA n=1 Tax=Nocardia puris TaxID=208602 RepID=A0A366DNI2_9NOCA|nr:hypothetical protein [Nocardia puris]RBO91653.1 hypothetical protein DFR74_104357 [Nocardia puris]
MATRSVPQPPFSTELLADLHADNIDPELGAQLWPLVRADADASRYLDSLDEVRGHVRELGAVDPVLHPMPDDVSVRLFSFLEDLESGEEPRATVHRLPEPSETSSAPTGPSEHLAPPVSLDERRGRRLRWLAAAAAVAAVVAGVGIGASVLGGDEEGTPVASPTENQIGDDLTATAALAALGRNDVTGPLADYAARDACVAAAGLTRPVLGSMNMTYSGQAAVLILLGGADRGQITALVVGPGCAPGDPQVKNITDIG